MSKKAITVSLLLDNKQVEIKCIENESLLEAMIRQGLHYPADCGGRGTCGKCRVRVVEGDLSISSQDEKVLTAQELQQGIRLACKLYPKRDSRVDLLYKEETDILSVSEFHINTCKILESGEKLKKTLNESIEHAEKDHRNVDKPYGIAIDLGTTTLAFSLIDITNQVVIITVTAINRQRAYGADVISRMKASNEGKGLELRDIIRLELERGIRSLLKKKDLDFTNIGRIVISGNTTMGHLLLGYSCETLGIYPFRPININTINVLYKELFSESYEIPVTILPGISTFVGGDIVSGIYACGINHSEKPCLLVDLGTNGEMAIGNKDKIIVASTAAGPAFEGGNLTCGVPSIPGAISQVSLTPQDIIIKTIQGEPPIGICGTGAIELISELFLNGVMDETGLLKDPYFETGYPVADFALYQKDIRELQLAKAAIRAGIEILIRQYGITYHELDRVYLAGGFGYQLDISKAVNIGLLPKELKDKIKAVGNSSLAGAVSSVLDMEVESEMKQLIQISQEIQLSNDLEFNDLYINSMSFEPLA